MNRISKTVSDLISQAVSKRKHSRIEVLEGRVADIEKGLKIVISEITTLRAELTALRSEKGLRSPKAKATPKTEAKPPPKAKPPSVETPKPKPPPKAKPPQPAPEIKDDIKDFEACRLKILDLLRDEKETTKQRCAEALSIDPALAGRTLNYMVAVKKEIKMISPPATQADPDPKKIFRLRGDRVGQKQTS